MSGYMHPCYAESLAEFGTPRELPRSGGWVLERQIPGFRDRDAMGCYPLFVCQDWSQLHSDLKTLESELVSLALVTDPFGKCDISYLRECFDMVIPFKEHFVADLHQPMDTFVSKHHRYYTRKSLQDFYVERCQDPTQFNSEWIGLYTNLIQRHNLVGIKAFSSLVFKKQMSIPGIVMFRAINKGSAIGAQLWFVQGEVGYSHLAAFNDLGYALNVSYALYGYAIKYFTDHFLGQVRWLDFGGGAGISNRGEDGLSQFKRGWSTGTRTANFCGRIFDSERYAEIVKAKGDLTTNYFPAYRKGEFG